MKEAPYLGWVDGSNVLDLVQSSLATSPAAGQISQ